MYYPLPGRILLAEPVPLRIARLLCPRLLCLECHYGRRFPEPQGVRGYMDVTPDLIASQIDAVFEDIDVDAVKIGMVSVPETIRVIADKLKQYQPPYIVIDPVMVATSGHRLLVPEAEQTLKEVLLPMADVLTPNLPEAEVLTGNPLKACTTWKKRPRPLPPWVPKPSWSKAVIALLMRRISSSTAMIFIIIRGNA